uniref:Somatotropin n=1 Tax=Xiphophorus couchianus TaxID=32473 RepID=A0A3B5MJ67_9TELE
HNIALCYKELHNKYHAELQSIKLYYYTKTYDRVLHILVLASESFVDPLCIDWLQVLKLLSISYRLVESWEFPSRSLSGGSGPRAQISPKLTELKMGIMLLIKANQDVPEIFTDTSTLQLAPYGNYYQSLEADESLRRTYELLACFKKDMHKVETYLTVAKCRLSPEANCTL